MFDTGGGSSQFTFGDGAEVVERFSVEVGAVRYTERFGLDRAVEQDALDEALAAISTDLSKLDGRPSPDALVGMGGAITNMTAVMLEMATYDPARVQGAALDRAEVDRQITPEWAKSWQPAHTRIVPGAGVEVVDLGAKAPGVSPAVVTSPQRAPSTLSARGDRGASESGEPDPDLSHGRLR